MLSNTPGNRKARMWLLIPLWTTLPITTGLAFTEAVETRSYAVRAVVLALLWFGWIVGLFAVLVHRTWALTAMRIVVPLSFLCSLITLFASHVSIAHALLAIVTIGGALILSFTPTFAQQTVNGLAYADEERFVCKIPPSLLLGALPITVVLIGIGLSAGPLLIAADNTAFGVIAIVIGFPLSVFACRLLHRLSKRWIVLVPAGITLVDQWTLAEPVLYSHSQIVSIGKSAGKNSQDHVADLRLGAVFHSIGLNLDDRVSLQLRKGRSTQKIRTDCILIAPEDPVRFLAVYNERAKLLNR